MKPKLLFISRKWTPAIGGMETYSVELAAALESHFDVTKLVLPGRSDGRPPSLPAYGLFVLKTILYCLLRGRRFGYVVFGDLLLFPAAVCCRMVRRDQRRAVVVYGLDLVYGKRRGLLPRCYSAYFAAFRSCQRLYSRVIAISNHTATLASAAGLNAVTVVKPSLPETPLTTARETETDLPASFVDARRKILQFGRLVPRKGALWFAQQVLPGLPGDVEFFVAGSAHGYAQLDELQGCDRTTCLGPVSPETLAALIRKADIVVMPNVLLPEGSQDVEGFGLVAIETSSLGGLLVASRLQGIADAVLDGITGLLVEPGNAEAWHRAVTDLMEESTTQQLERRETARTQTRLNYSRNRMGEEFVKCLTATA